MKRFPNKIKNFIDKNALLSENDRVIVALSGGADSVCLISILQRLGYECEAAHCNFHLRGNESMRDEEFVTTLCQRLGITLHKVDFSTAEYAEQHKQSIEMAARELRYDWFEKLRVQTNAKAIAVAHHMDDNAETFMLNLSRGTGIQGLKGMSPRNGFIVRPLLCVHRAEIIGFLQEIGQDFVTDSTNLEDIYHRNFIRLRLLPEMQTLNPSVTDAINTTSQHIAEAFSIYKEAIENYRKRLCHATENGMSIDTAELLQTVSPRTILFECLKHTHINETQLDNILAAAKSANSGKQFRTDTHRIMIERDSIEVVSVKETTKESLFDDWIIEQVDAMPTDFKSIPKTEAYINGDLIDGELTMRRWQNGDRFYPLGMDGSKLVSDYMTDRKFSRTKKEKQLLLCHGNDIVWLVNERVDNRFRVTDGCKRILHIKRNK